MHNVAIDYYRCCNSVTVTFGPFINNIITVKEWELLRNSLIACFEGTGKVTLIGNRHVLSNNYYINCDCIMHHV